MPQDSKIWCTAQGEYFHSSENVEWCVKIVWLSAGVSSFISGYLAENVDKYIYIDIKDQHPDSMRFIKDCEKVLGKEVEILKSDKFSTVEEVDRKFKYINGVGGAPCTGMLKKAVRHRWEAEHQGQEITYVWGMDANEKNRAERIIQSMPEFKHEFPLIDANMKKAEAHGLLDRLGIKRPVMYDMGYPNNNCVGCVKGGMGYWNKIRVDFPEIFKKRAKMERDIGATCINGVYLDELDPEAGRNKVVVADCGIMCELALIKKTGQF